MILTIILTYAAFSAVASSSGAIVRSQPEIKLL
jgi:hypothetical protein